MCLYPETAKGQPGEAVEVWVAAQYLTIANATREDTKAWGTFVYTDDSDVLKGSVLQSILLKNPTFVCIQRFLLVLNLFFLQP